MEKLFKVVCKNFAIVSEKPLKCSYHFEGQVDNAVIMFIGFAAQKWSISAISKFLNLDQETVRTYIEMWRDLKASNDKRFHVKTALILKGLEI